MHGYVVDGQPPNTSSWYHFNLDGSTDEQDLQGIRENLGAHYLKK